MTTIVAGSVVYLSLELRRRTGEYYDPPALLLHVAPVGSGAAYERRWPDAPDIAHDGTGRFHLDFAVPSVTTATAYRGWWRALDTDGTELATVPFQFDVRRA